MKKFTAALCLGATLTLALSSIACANESVLFPTDVLKKEQVGATLGYEFQYGAKQNDYAGGHYDYSETQHKTNVDAQIGLGYGLQAGAAWSIVPSARVTNDNYSTAPGVKGVFNHSGGSNPVFSLKYNPTELLKLSKDIGLAVGYSYKPGKWGSTQLRDYGFDTHKITAHGSLATGEFRNYLGYEGEFNDAKDFRIPNEHAIVIGTEFDYSKKLSVTADLKSIFVGAAEYEAGHKMVNLDLGVQYALKHNVWLVPSYGIRWIERHAETDQVNGAEMLNTWGLALRTVF